MKKKVLAALMCAAMTVGMLAGCGGNSTAGNSSSGAGEAASGTESADSGAGRREMDVEGDDVTTLEVWTGLSTLFQTNFFRLFFRYCTGV